MSNLTLPEELRGIACTIDCEHHERILREAARHVDRLEKSLSWMTRCARFRGPVGLTLYAIADEKMNEARMALGMTPYVPLDFVSNPALPPE